MATELDPHDLTPKNNGKPDGPNAGRFTFTDLAGREWDVTLTYEGALRIDDVDFRKMGLCEEDVSILSPDKKFFTDTITSTKMIFAMIWTVIEPQAERQGVTLEDWRRALNGPAIADAKEAFWGTLADFFQDQKTALSRLMETNRKAIRLIDKEMAATCDEMDRAIEKRVATGTAEVRRQLRETLGTDSTPSAESSAGQSKTP